MAILPSWQTCSRTLPKDKLHSPPQPLKPRQKSFFASPWLPAPGPAPCRGARGWEAARRGAAQRGRVELCSCPGLPRHAARCSPREPGRRRGPAGIHAAGRPAASQRDSRDSPASRRDLTVERPAASAAAGGTSSTRRRSGLSLLSRRRPRPRVRHRCSATYRFLSFPRLLPWMAILSGPSRQI